MGRAFAYALAGALAVVGPSESFGQQKAGLGNFLKGGLGKKVSADKVIFFLIRTSVCWPGRLMFFLGVFSKTVPYCGVGSFTCAVHAGQAELGRQVLAEGRKSLAEKRADNTDTRALAKVLALFEEGLLREEEVDLFYRQMRSAEVRTI